MPPRHFNVTSPLAARPEPVQRARRPAGTLALCAALVLGATTTSPAFEPAMKLPDDPLTLASSSLPETPASPERADRRTTQVVLPEAQGVAPAPQAVAAEAQAGDAEAQAVVPEAQAVADEAKAVTPDAQPAADEAQAVAKEAQAVAPEVKGVSDDAKAVSPEAKAVAPTAQPVASEAKAGAPEAQAVAMEAQAVAVEAKAVADTTPGTPGTTEPATPAAPKWGPVQIVVYKARRSLALYRFGNFYREYPVVLGMNPEGRKRHAHDARTPEGLYHVVKKRPHERWQYFLDLDYPNDKDRRIYTEEKSAGRIPDEDGSPFAIGGSIGIHGNDRADQQAAGIDWTKGCIALEPADIAEIEALTPVGTPVWIVR